VRGVGAVVAVVAVVAVDEDEDEGRKIVGYAVWGWGGEVSFWFLLF
jgi:hypothetical protein